MKLGAPSDEEIRRAEGRLTDARRELAASRVRARAAFRATLAKPTTLLGVALASGAAGYFLFRRPPEAEAARNWLSRWPALGAQWEALRSHLPTFGGPSAAATATTAAGATSLVGIVLAFAARYALQQLPRMGLQIVEHALRRQRAAPLRAYPARTALH